MPASQRYKLHQLISSSVSNNLKALKTGYCKDLSKNNPFSKCRTKYNIYFSSHSIWTGECLDFLSGAERQVFPCLETAASWRKRYHNFWRVQSFSTRKQLSSNVLQHAVHNRKSWKEGLMCTWNCFTSPTSINQSTFTYIQVQYTA